MTRRDGAKCPSTCGGDGAFACTFRLRIAFHGEHRIDAPVFGPVWRGVYEDVCDANRLATMSKAEAVNETGVREDLDALKADLRTLRADMQGLTRDLTDAGRDTVNRAKEQASDAAHKAAGAARERGEQAVDSFDSQVRKNPYTACGVAFVAGAVISSLLWGRS